MTPARRAPPLLPGLIAGAGLAVLLAWVVLNAIGGGP